MIHALLVALVWMHEVYCRCVGLLVRASKKLPWRSINVKRWDRHTRRWLLVMDEDTNFEETAVIENFTDIYGTFEFSLIARGRVDTEMSNARLALAIYQETEDPQWVESYRRHRASASLWRKEICESEQFIPKRNFINWFNKMERERGLGVPWPQRPKCSTY